MDGLCFPRRRKRPAARRRSLHVECLERRQLLSVAASANVAPRALQDEAETVGNTPVVIDVIRNDSDADGTLDPKSVVISSGPKAGSAAVRVDGSVVYTPPADRLGIDSFYYNVKDDRGALSNGALVVISVRSVWQNPDNPLDVNDDGGFSPIDVLRLLNELNRGGSRMLPQPAIAPVAPPPFLDTTGDGYLTPADAMLAINCLNSQGQRGSVAACRVSPLPVFAPATDSVGSTTDPVAEPSMDDDVFSGSGEVTSTVLVSEPTPAVDDVVSEAPPAEAAPVEDSGSLSRTWLADFEKSADRDAGDSLDADDVDELLTQSNDCLSPLLPGGLDDLALL